MNGIAEVLEDKLIEAVEKKDRKAIKHFVTIIIENFEDKKEAEKKDEELMLKLHEIEITIKEGFKYVDKHFEDIDKRFTMMVTFYSIGFTILAGLITIFKFIK